MTVERIHEVDGTVAVLETLPDGKKYLELNGLIIDHGFFSDDIEEFEDKFDSLITGLKAHGYEYEDYIIDRKGELEPMESRFVLIREYPDGSLDDLAFSDDRSDLVEKFEDVENQ